MVTITEYKPEIWAHGAARPSGTDDERLWKASCCLRYVNTASGRQGCWVPSIQRQTSQRSENVPEERSARVSAGGEVKSDGLGVWVQHTKVVQPTSVLMEKMQC
jgi:hypothetical protein